MTSETFFENFALLADAPNGVQKLREMILQLAVQGKLVPQDPSDEPAAVLLEKIKVEKRQLSKEDKDKTKKQPLFSRLHEETLNIPASWVLCRLGEISEIVMGNSPPGDTYNERGEGVPLINGPVEFSRDPLGSTIKSKFTTEPTKLCKKNDLLICVRGATTGRTNIAGFEACIGRGVALIRASFYQKYINLFILAYRQRIFGLGKGSTFPSISFRQIADLSTPLPPLSEQHRIVAKVDQLMALCDELEARQQKQNGSRTRLSTAAIDKLLTARKPDEFAEHWQRICDHFDLLSDTPESIGQLRQTILQLAVQGKLVSQDPNDEPASVLLEKIRLEKERLVEEKKIKKDKIFASVTKLEPPWVVPETWSWVRLQDVFELSRGGSPRPAGDPQYFGGGIPWITVGEITKDRDKYLTTTTEGLTELGSSRSRFIYPEDLLLTNSGATLGVPKISLIKGCINDGVAILKSFHENIYKEYAYLFLLQQTGAFRAVNQGMGQPNLNTPILAGWFFPLVPFQEQRRIVARVDQLMSLCDKLEAKLKQSQTDSEQLMDAMVQNVLAA